MDVKQFAGGIMIRWQDMPDGQEKRAAYMASREWALKREAIRARCGGKCEQCGKQEMYSTHHLTYRRLYNEDLTDLLGLCNACHAYVSGKRVVFEYRLPVVADFIWIALPVAKAESDIRYTVIQGRRVVLRKFPTYIAALCEHELKQWHRYFALATAK